MADVFTPMGGVPDFYSQMMNTAQQQLVRLPDGTLVQAPQYGAGGSLGDIYGGILPDASVHSIEVQPNGQPVLPAVNYGSPATTMAQTQAEQRAARNALPRASGTLTASSSGYVPGPRGSTSLTKSQARMDAGYPLAFAGETSAPGLAAIDGAIQPLPAASRWGWGSMGNIAPLQWENINPLPGDGGDPWAGMTIGGRDPARPGMTNGSRTPTAAGKPPSLGIPGLLGFTIDLLTGRQPGGLLGMAMNGLQSLPKPTAPPFNANTAAPGSPIAQAISQAGNGGGGGLQSGGVFAAGEQLPPSMNNRRWAGDGY